MTGSPDGKLAILLVEDDDQIAYLMQYILEQDGYRIPESQRDNLMTQLQASRDPVALLESWRSLFSRDPIGAKIDMSRAAMPKTVSGGDISSLVKEFAGKPEEFAKAINSRIKR